jgi:2-(1,2-epoxy-1,2-dihydrophenyl)acetyl-CoA isomerase
MNAEASAGSGPVLRADDGAVATVTLNRADRRNALDFETKLALRDRLDEVAGDDSVRAVVLTGAGSAFCVGQDLAEHAANLADDASTAFDTVAHHYGPIVRALATMPKPVVAAVNGACVGAGLAFALACDLRVFSATALLGTAFSGIGLTCDSGLSATLTAEVGPGRARELLLLGDSFSPADAAAWGVAGRVVDPDAVLPTALDLAARLAAGPTAAYAETKSLVAAAGCRTLSDTLAAEHAAQARCGLTADHTDAVTAFLDRRRPVFHGR